MPKIWKPVKIGHVEYDLSHLNAYQFTSLISQKVVTIHVEYHSNHVFTDVKGTGYKIYANGELRYFCLQRYQDSKLLPKLIKEDLLSEYVYVYKSRKGEAIYYKTFLDYVVFVTLSRSSSNVIRLKVISAYTLDEWGKQTLPHGRLYRLRFVIAEKLEKRGVLKKKKRRNSDA